MSFFQSKNASTTWSAVSQTTDQWNLDFKCDLCETTNHTSSGYQSNLDGVFSCSATCEGPYNGSLGLTQGQLITITFATGGGGPSFAIPLRIQSIRISTPNVRNTVAKFALTMESSGTFSVTF